MRAPAAPGGEAGPGSGPALSVDVPALLGGVRVDRALSILTGVSRSVAAGLVASGRVSIDGETVTARRTPLVAGQVLHADLAGVGMGPVAEPDVVFEVVHADEDLVVVDKPAGLVVHPGAGHRTGTLVGGLLARFPDLQFLVEAGVCHADRPGLVHRLDRGTSGLLVVARTERAYQSLTAQLADRTMDRRYLALVAGHVAEDRGAVEAPIGRSARTPVKMAVSAGGRPARTDYEVVDRFDEPLPSTLLRVRLQTGRTHQIRVHLSAIGHPVVGDDRYGGPGGLLAPGRAFLHAYLLGFDHPADGSRRSWRSELPPDLVGVLPAASREW